MARTLAGIEAAMAKAESSIQQTENEAEVSQRNLERYAKQADQLHAVVEVEQEMFRRKARYEQACHSMEAATRGKEEAKARLVEHQGWTADLRHFFKGRRPQNADAILRGLQAMLPSRDPLPHIIGTMFSDAHLDIDGSTARSVYSMVDEHL